MPSLVVTPFSKKQPPPNDRPTVWTLWIATWKASSIAGVQLGSLFGLPFQSDHPRALTGWLMVIITWGSVASVTWTGFDHQNCVKKPVSGRSAEPPLWHAGPDGFGETKKK